MMDAGERPDLAQLRSLLAAGTRIPAVLVDRLMSSVDREEQAEAYNCLAAHAQRIQPDMEFWITAPFVGRFLLDCIADPSTSAALDSPVPSNYEAARDLVSVLRDWIAPAGDKTILADLLDRIDRTFLDGDERVRACIETGFLEHALESPELRPLFAHWADHAELREAHSFAMEWGRAHEHGQKRTRRPGRA
jgi:hypothetical protein